MSSYEELVRSFERPGAGYRAKPFWSWNGELDEAELIRQIDCFQEMGMGGYFCHSRVGLKTPYLGEKWFKCVRACVDKGVDAGMETWLYDEDRWPSGIAGGLVTQDQSLRMSFIRLRIEEGCDFAFADNTICAFQARLDGLSLFEYRRIDPDTPPIDGSVLHFTHEYMESDSFYNDTAYVDTLNTKAVGAFIEATHEKYVHELSAEQVDVVKGIFTDEPHHGPVMCGFSLKNKDARYLVPYTPELFGRFRDRFGYSLEEKLPELFLWKNGIKVQPIKWQYNELLTELFCHNFMKPIHDWCVRHGLQLTGHLLHEDTLTAQTAMAGSLIRSYGYMDIPGIDLLGEHNANYWIAKQVQSAARQNGSKQILSEMYGCTGWQMAFENYKSVGDWQALFGVNFRCPHLSWYTMQGEGKRDFPASIGSQSAWYSDFSYVEDYFARIHAFMEPGEPCCDLLVISPLESVWAQVYPGWADELTCLDPDIIELENQYASTFHALAGNGIDFDYGDEGVLAEKGLVKRDSGGTYLEVGHCRYRSVLISGLTTMRSSTLALCREFSKAGGTICLAGPRPRFMDAAPCGDLFDFPIREVDLQSSGLAASLGVYAPAEVCLFSGESVKTVFRMARRDGSGQSLFLLNTDRLNSVRVRVRLRENGLVEKWNPRDGARTRVDVTDGAFEYEFAPSEELLLRISPLSGAVLPGPRPRSRLEVLTGCIDGPMEFCLSEPNAAVLAYVDFCVDGGSWHRDAHILAADRYVREQFDLPLRGNEMVQPWADDKPAPAICRLTLRYPFAIESVPEDIYLVVESPELFSVTVNGETGLLPADQRWVDCAFTCLKLPAELLCPGGNYIELAGEFDRKLDIEAVYLLGSFGVRVTGTCITLTDMPAAVQPGDITESGFPFYSGRFGYKCRLLEVSPGQRLYLRTERIGAALIRITDGVSSAVMAYQPFETDVTAMSGREVRVEYVLTRQNAFGSAAGSGYSFMEQGMLSPITWTITDETDG